ncbi:TRAP transporter fused permease subunit [Arhodomonas aquaeolei]|uniref:TRAP transporter permease n=1 Tax=Arhodomonas aquaeolei TaxID=2369 RepID=UPI002168942C|nr:TRAP transporter fused permease subunit [Arhodomonas aquaeolei]MCS4505870.1 TRAP transporter fused permease subunit [Arhodomonas aquaeolei]
MYRAFTYSAKAFALGLSLFQIYAAVFGLPPLMIHYILFLCVVLALVFSTPPENASLVRLVFDAAAVLLTIAIAVYFIDAHERIVSRIAFVDELHLFDKVLGVALIALLLEATRRVAGYGLFVVALVFVLYGFTAPYLPGALYHSGLTFDRFIDIQVMSTNGVLGIPLGVVATYIFYFILFAVFLEISGGGQLFIDLAFSLTGRTRGGPAKSAVVASGIMGSINGSAVANVVGTGTFTIPLMRRGGYTPTFAAATEAAASTGGQFMPPIMGAAAFVMVELTGLSYVHIIAGAAIPALLYYFSLFAAVHLEAKKNGLEGLKKGEMPQVFSGLWRRVHLLLPIAVLVYLLIDGRTLMTSAFYALLVTVAVSFVRPDTRIGLRDIVNGLDKASRSVLIVAVPCAAAGVIIGIIVQTGIGMRVTDAILAVSGGNLVLCLIAMMFSCIILGMGMPTVAAYIMVATLMGSALTQLDVNLLSAHLFIFYFALLSFVTPPVALAAYAAAGIAQTESGRTGWRAFTLTWSGFLIPYAFVFNPALVADGSVWEIIWATLSVGAGCYALAGSVIGMHAGHSGWVERGVGAVAALALIAPNVALDLGGAGLLAVLIAYQIVRDRRAGTAAAVSAGEPDPQRSPSS